MHMELYDIMMYLERLVASFFPRFENLSEDATIAQANNLTLHRLEQLVVHKNYLPADLMTKDYGKVH